MMIGTYPQNESFTSVDELVEAPRADWRELEMELAREVQNRAFPTMRPRIAGLDYYSDWRPACGLSGDYLDYFELPEGHLGLAIGDVAGKGVAAALLTSSLHGLGRALRHGQSGSLSALATSIDELFYEVCPDNSYATMFLARLDPARGLLHYVNAGHEPPVVLRKTDSGYRPIALEATGPVIGMLRKPAFHENMVALAEGDLLVAFTDGLCETANSRGEEFGFRRLLGTIQSCAYRKAHEIVEQVLETAAAFAGGCPQFDDMTLWLGRLEEAHLRIFPVAEEIALPAVA